MGIKQRRLTVSPPLPPRVSFILIVRAAESAPIEGTLTLYGTAVYCLNVQFHRNTVFYEACCRVFDRRAIRRSPVVSDEES